MITLTWKLNGVEITATAPTAVEAVEAMERLRQAGEPMTVGAVFDRYHQLKRIPVGPVGNVFHNSMGFAISAPNPERLRLSVPGLADYDFQNDNAYQTLSTLETYLKRIERNAIERMERDAVACRR